MSDLAVFQAPDENILGGSAITADHAPSASYSLSTLGSNNPAARVRWGTKTVTITFTLSEAKRGDVLVIPVTNLDSVASPTILRLTNGAGMDVNVLVPAMPRNRIPLTLVCDLTLLETDDTIRTSDAWHLVISNNSENVILGGAVLLYGPKTQFSTWDVQWGGTDSKTAQGAEVANEYGTRYRQTYETQVRSVTVTKLATADEADALEGWYDACGGRFGTAGMLWPDLSVNDALFGTPQATWSKQRIAPNGPLSTDVIYQIQMTFDELAKGKPV
jgi:hypothetical protein